MDANNAVDDRPQRCLNPFAPGHQIGGMSERLDAGCEFLLLNHGIIFAAKGLRRHCLHHCERILHPMVQFIDDEAQMLLGLLSRRYVACRAVPLRNIPRIITQG